MSREFRLPDLGEGVHEGQIVRVHVKEGDVVREDQPLLEVETDKAAVEIPSPFSGRVSKVHVDEQQLVKVGEVMVSFAETGASTLPIHDGAAKKTGAAVAASGIATTAPPTTPSVTTVATGAPAARPSGRPKPASPAVRKLARSLGLDLQSLTGSGPGGRVTRADVERSAREQSSPAARSPAAAPAPSVVIEHPAATLPPARLAPVADLSTTPGEPGRDHWGPVSVEPVSRVRATIAANMTRSWTTTPHVTDSFDVDVTELDRLRRRHNERRPGEVKLTMLPFVVRAVASLLPRHPLLNASWDGEHDRITYRRYVNVAIGVHTERGLVAPVLRDADQMGIAAMTARLNEIIEKARTASFAVDDLRGGTFTISNPGAMGGSRYSTPIINPPQAAVLAIGRSGWQPSVVDGAVVPRYLMPLSLSFDHRLVDGGTEVAFQSDLVATLENPVELML